VSEVMSSYWKRKTINKIRLSMRCFRCGFRILQGRMRSARIEAYEIFDPLEVIRNP